MTIYDETVGDSTQQIGPGTPFADLPADYGCSVCGSPASDFVKQAPLPDKVQIAG
jgi:rubredoxin